MSLRTVSSTAAIVAVDAEPQAGVVRTALARAQPASATSAIPTLTSATAECRRQTVLVRRGTRQILTPRVQARPRPRRAGSRRARADGVLGRCPGWDSNPQALASGGF